MNKNDYYFSPLNFEFECFFFCRLLSLKHNILVLWYNYKVIPISWNNEIFESLKSKISFNIIIPLMPTFFFFNLLFQYTFKKFNLLILKNPALAILLGDKTLCFVPTLKTFHSIIKHEIRSVLEVGLHHGYISTRFTLNKWAIWEPFTVFCRYHIFSCPLV